MAEECVTNAAAIERDNFMLLTKQLILCGEVTFMPIQGEKAICTTRPRLSMLFEVLNPFYAFLICSSTIMSCGDDPVRW